jgi:hypothetical protein
VALEAHYSLRNENSMPTSRLERTRPFACLLIAWETLPHIDVILYSIMGVRWALSQHTPIHWCHFIKVTVISHPGLIRLSPDSCAFMYCSWSTGWQDLDFRANFQHVVQPPLLSAKYSFVSSMLQ